MNRAGLAIGVFAIVIGLAIGYAMIAMPEGLDPAYPLGAALLAPAAIVCGGLLFCVHAAGRAMLVAGVFGVLALTLLALVHWGAWFGDHIQCRQAFSFVLGMLAGPVPAEVACRNGLRVLLLLLDAGLIAVVAAVIVRRLLARRARAAT